MRCFVWSSWFFSPKNFSAKARVAGSRRDFILMKRKKKLALVCMVCVFNEECGTIFKIEGGDLCVCSRLNLRWGWKKEAVLV